MTWPSWRDWLFSAKTFAAAMLALYIALSADLPRPYWAMTTVYVVANPLVGATNSKAIYRSLGTLLGACGAVLLLPIFITAPPLLILAVAVWAACFLFVAQMNRTPRGYIFMLASYTLPLVALPTVLAPETIFDTAVARSEEIILGIACASLVGALVFPVSAGPTLAARLSDWLRDAGSWAREILRGTDGLPALSVARQRLAADIVALDALVRQLSYEAGVHGTSRRADELRGRLMFLLPLLSSLGDRLHALRLETGGMAPELVAVAGEIADWIGQGMEASPQAGDGFRARLALLEPSKDEMRQWGGLVGAGAVARLRELVDLWDDCHRLRRQIAEGAGATDWRPALRHRPLIGRARHHDFGMMLFASGSVLLATTLAGLIWIFSGWTGGAYFVAMTTVACCFFGPADQPLPSMRTMFIWCAVALVIDAGYLFAVFPMIDGFMLLALVLAPLFLLVGAFVPRPQLALITLLLAANGAGSLAIQSRYNVEFAGYVNEGLAVLSGLLFATVWTAIAKPFGAEIAARRLARAGWADLAALAAGRRGNQADLISRTLDRLGQLVPRLAAGAGAGVAAIDGLAELRIGYNLVDLQRDRRVLPPAIREPIDLVLGQVATFFEARSLAVATSAPASLIDLIDQAIAAIFRDGQGGVARDALNALVGLRRALYPEAPGPTLLRD